MSISILNYKYAFKLGSLNSTRSTCFSCLIESMKLSNKHTRNMVESKRNLSAIITLTT